MAWLLLLAIIVIAILALTLRQTREHAIIALDDAVAEAHQVNERLGGQILNLTGTNDTAKQALADAAERHYAAAAQLDRARTPTQAHLARRTALEGLHHIRTARLSMHMDPGTDLPPL
ncbi:hypothetical protein ACWEKT_18695 [Nocardia takedensis]|uniref:hypothetical protein n=1 Tax=Nocardia takedensis TaxID=259390 RepID=UPI0005954089